MMTAMLASENILGASHDIWEVNVEEAYHEEASDESEQQVTHGHRGGDRLVPERIEADRALDAIRDAFAHYDPVALGVAVGGLLGIGLFFATAMLLLEGGTDVGSHLSLLGNFFIGYEVSWTGAFIALLEGAIGGFLFGYLLAKAINTTIEIHKRLLFQRLEMAAAIEAVEEERM